MTPPGRNISDSSGAWTSSTNITLTGEEFEEIRRLIKATAGINLSTQKLSLVKSRLAKRLRELGLSSYSDYIEMIKASGDGGELVEMINQITTNKTDFFREPHHFTFLKEKVLPAMVAQGKPGGERVLRCWSAACSSGEEPYSLAITLNDFFQEHPSWKWRLLATDLDTNMLAKAISGRYEADRLAPVPAPVLRKYFQKPTHGESSIYTVKSFLRDKITFRKFNLMQANYPFKAPLNFIFCRNVLIYFDSQDKLAILKKLHRALAPGGHLFVGHSESLMIAKDLFSNAGTTVYRKKEGLAAPGSIRPEPR